MLSEGLQHCCELPTEDSHRIEQEGSFLCEYDKHTFLIDDFFTVINHKYETDFLDWLEENDE
ncbi:hypothetical protein [Aneurinibacillus tyrosinisolvens]|uniref:hypothetical protein n=1 Tax=Aneurinibacillus tyrosinisolvens TaxID=1443435 RepID=UPI00063EE2F7|nr:hypothetical protein [Aneurinibacillus tyrosinisolvens]